ncbi:MAG: sulfurtransferase complex subunit TusD [Pseudomonadota bacterium]
MKYTLAIHGSPYASGAHLQAILLCEAILRAGHTITRVFFYHDAVNVALNTLVAPQDEANLNAKWQQLAHEHGLELAVCIANGLKRGVVSTGEAKRYKLDHPSLSEGFELVGLGQLIDAIATSDRYIEIPT